jgi:REP element-mobilizing transposase RayT
MSGGYKIDDQYGMYYCTFQIVYWIDIFSRNIYRDILLDSFRNCCDEKGLRIHAYVIISNHVHCILSSTKIDLSTIIQSFKSFTSREIIKAIQENNESRREWLLWMFERAAKKHKRNTKYQVWTHENQPKQIVSNEFMDQKLNYIHENPVRARLVVEPEHYLYSSARNYAGLPGLLKVDLQE